MANLETEIRTYNEKLPELLAHVGKYALVHGSKVEGIFESYSEALRQGYAKFGEKRFLVKRIAPAESVAFFSKDMEFKCQA